MNQIEVDSDWSPIRQAVQRTALSEASFVLRAIGIEHAIERDGDLWALWVPAASAERAAAELDSYGKEKRSAAQPRARVIVVDSGWAGALGYLFVIWLLPTLEGWARLLPWREQGEMHASALLTGQWWRAVTALTLHADLAHLAANSVFGTVIGLLVGRNFGSGVGWLSVLLCGAAGNALDALWRPEDFHSIGASTATFAAVGLVGSAVWRHGYYRTINWRRSFAPIVAALALLAFTGTAGDDTDVVAHVMGLVSGLVCGAVIAGFDVRRIGTVGQWVAGLAALSAVCGSWWVALR